MLGIRDSVLLIGQRHIQTIISVLIFLLGILNFYYTSGQPEYHAIMTDATISIHMKLFLLLFGQVMVLIIIFFTGYILYKISITLINVRLRSTYTKNLTANMKYPKEWILIVYFVVALLTIILKVLTNVAPNVLSVINVICYVFFYFIIFGENRIVFTTLFYVLLISTLSSHVLS